MLQNPLASRIAAFLTSIGLSVRTGELTESTFLPGLTIDHGTLVVDEARLLYPGDLLHEAGHLAVVSPAGRAAMCDNVGQDPGSEMAAIAWSYAAAVHIGLDVNVLFHPDGYKGASATLIQAFTSGRAFGVPVLDWLGLTADSKHALERGVAPYPAMLRWLREE